MMKTIEIKSEPKEKTAVSESLVRQMYDLLGANMTQIVGCASPDWQSDAEFSKWRKGLFSLMETPRHPIDPGIDPGGGILTMQTVKFVSWEEDGAWIGYLQDYPDYWTQGETLDDLKDHLRDLYHDLIGGDLPGIRKVDELVVS
jgi:hypothetical protein